MAVGNSTPLLSTLNRHAATLTLLPGCSSFLTLLCLRLLPSASSPFTHTLPSTLPFSPLLSHLPSSQFTAPLHCLPLATATTSQSVLLPPPHTPHPAPPPQHTLTPLTAQAATALALTSLFPLYSLSLYLLATSAEIAAAPAWLCQPPPQPWQGCRPIRPHLLFFPSGRKQLRNLSDRRHQTLR